MISNSVGANLRKPNMCSDSLKKKKSFYIFLDLIVKIKFIQVLVAYWALPYLNSSQKHIEQHY